MANQTANQTANHTSEARHADADAIEAADEKYVMRPWTHPAGEPVIIAKGRGCVVTDVHGKEYLDLTAGYFVNNAGHCHPRIIEAATKQLGEVLQVSGKHGTIPMIRLAEKPPSATVIARTTLKPVIKRRPIVQFFTRPPEGTKKARRAKSLRALNRQSSPNLDCLRRPSGSRDPDSA